MVFLYWNYRFASEKVFYERRKSFGKLRTKNDEKTVAFRNFAFFDRRRISPRSWIMRCFICSVNGCWPPALIAESGGWDTASLVIATALGFCAGLTVNWILSVRFVFRNVKDKEKSRSKKSFAVFALIGLIGLGITELRHASWCLLSSRNKIVFNDLLFGARLKEWSESGDDLPRFGLELSGAEAVCI